MKTWIAAVAAGTCLLAGCSTFHDVGKDMKAAGAELKDDFSNMGPEMKKGLSDMKEGFRELGQGISKDFKSAVQEIKK